MVGLHRINELEAIARHGAVVVLKIDGKRKNNIYTVVLSGGRLKSEDFFPTLIDSALQFYEEHGVA